MSLCPATGIFRAASLIPWSHTIGRDCRITLSTMEITWALKQFTEKFKISASLNVALTKALITKIDRFRSYGWMSVPNAVKHQRFFSSSRMTLLRPTGCKSWGFSPGRSLQPKKESFPPEMFQTEWIWGCWVWSKMASLWNYSSAFFEELRSTWTGRKTL